MYRAWFSHAGSHINLALCIQLDIHLTEMEVNIIAGALIPVINCG